MKWANLRLDVASMRRLERYRLNLEVAIAKQPSRYPEWMHGKRLSLGDAVAFLLNKVDGHRDREKRNRCKKEWTNGEENAILPLEGSGGD